MPMCQHPNFLSISVLNIILPIKNIKKDLWRAKDPCRAIDPWRAKIKWHFVCVVIYFGHGGVVDKPNHTFSLASLDLLSS